MMNLDDPVATALKITRLLEHNDVAYGLYGGLAVAAWGVPRETPPMEPVPGANLSHAEMPRGPECRRRAEESDGLALVVICTEAAPRET